MSSPVRLGQLVRLVNLRPDDDGRSLNGTLARVEWLPKVWDPKSPSFFVEYYRRHRRTGRPLPLKTNLFRIDQVETDVTLTPEETELLALIEPMRQQQRYRRQKARADRIIWQKEILALGTPEGIMRTKKRDLAEKGIAQLEQELTTNPPLGLSQADIASFFEREGSTLVDALRVTLNQINATLPQVFKLDALIEDGIPFDITIEKSGVKTLYTVFPDVDGIEVQSQHAPVPIKLDEAIDGPSLLKLMAHEMPELKASQLVSIEEQDQE